MADSVTPNPDTTPEPTSTPEAKSHFAKAMEEAKAGAKALGKEAQDRADAYREKAGQASGDWVDEAKARAVVRPRPRPPNLPTRARPAPAGR